MRLGILGCGAIAPSYLRNLTGPLSSQVEVAACADLDPRLSEKLAAEFGVARSVDSATLLADSEIDMVVNLTPAPAHYAASLEVLQAGKHLFTEKPLCLSLAEAKLLLEIAARNKLQIGGAADTILGGSLHRCRTLIEEGAIGMPIAAQILCSVGTHDSRRYHQVFRGALLDLGPYYLTAMVMLFGSVKRVCGIADIRFPTKTESATGETFELDRASTAAAALSFESGLVATLIASEDVHGYFPCVEVFGRKGRMKLSDANMYGAPLEMESYQERRTLFPSTADGFVGKGRGLGVAEMALALREGREPRCDGRLLYHVLEVMLAVYESSDGDRHRSIESKAPVFAPLSPAEAKALWGKSK